MKAIVSERYGPPESLELREIDAPAVDADSVLISVRAAAVNPLDWHFVRGEPRFARLISGLRRPKRPVRGRDVAGVVEETGANVTRLRPGDEVFGVCSGAFAEVTAAAEDGLAPKPARLSFEQAAAMPIAGCTALQALRDHGRLQPGQSVLVNGASGGVGTFAVQIAKALGGEVTGVCSTTNLELVRSIGADHVVDYTVEDFTRSGRRYDLVVQIVGNQSLSDLRRALAPAGTLVIVGGGVGRDGGGGPLALLAQLLRMRVRSRLTKQRLAIFMAKVTTEHLLALNELVDEGKVTPVVDPATYGLSDTPQALRYLEAGHARGKVVIAIS